MIRSCMDKFILKYNKNKHLNVVLLFYYWSIGGLSF